MNRWFLGCGVAALVVTILVVAAALLGAGAWFWFSAHPSTTAPGVVVEPSVANGNEASAATGERGVVFVRQETLYWKSGDAAPEVALTRGAWPALSPDGTRVAFFRRTGAEDDPGGEWCVMDRATRAIRPLIPSAAANSLPAWSPDGTAFVAVVHANENVHGVFVIPADGATPTEVTGTQARPDLGYLLYPAFTSNGLRIVFHDMTHLITVSRDGEEVERLALARITGARDAVTSTDRFTICPTNPDLIAYSALVEASGRLRDAIHGEPTNALFVYNRRTGQRRAVTGGTMVATDPAWTPDGAALYFSGYAGEAATELTPFRIHRVRADGSGLTPLVLGEQPAP